MSGGNLDITWITTAFSAQGEGVFVDPIIDPTGSGEGVSDPTVSKAEPIGNTGEDGVLSGAKKLYTSFKFENGKLCLPLISEDTDASKPESRVTDFSEQKCFTKVNYDSK